MPRAGQIPACSSGFRSAPAHTATLAPLHRSFPSPSTSRHLAEQDYPSLRHYWKSELREFFPPKHLPLREAGHHFHFSLCFPRGGNALVNNSRIPEGKQSLTGHKTPHLCQGGHPKSMSQVQQGQIQSENRAKKKREYLF